MEVEVEKEEEAKKKKKKKKRNGASSFSGVFSLVNALCQSFNSSTTTTHRSRSSQS